MIHDLSNFNFALTQNSDYDEEFFSLVSSNYKQFITKLSNSTLFFFLEMSLTITKESDPSTTTTFKLESKILASKYLNNQKVLRCVSSFASENKLMLKRAGDLTNIF